MKEGRLHNTVPYETAEREAGTCTESGDSSGGGAMPAGGQGASLKPRIKAPVPLKMWPGVLLAFYSLFCRR